MDSKQTAVSAAHTPGACPVCNGVLAAELVKTCTPEQVAHAAVHALSERDALLAALNAIIREYNQPGEWDYRTIASNMAALARAALAKVQP